MWAYCLNNPVAMVDSNGQETNWNTLFGGIELLLVAAVGFASVATVLSGGCAAPLLVLTIAAMTASAATVSAACGTAEVVEAFTDHNFIRDDILKGDTERYERTKNTSRTIAMMGSAGLNAYSPVCFVEGTLVQTNDGLKPIESISPDMLVYASDPETGKIESHKVVQTFVNETDEITYISLSNGEEIVTTPTHPFYVPAYGWTAAIDLRAGDILVTVNGERIVIEQVKHELLESPITVYNFEVEDLHTYFVGSCGVLVHNKCVVNENGVKIESYYPNDHGNPAHLHVKGGGGATKIGPNGLPVRGYPPLTPKQASVVSRNLPLIKKTIKVIQKGLKSTKNFTFQ